MLRPSRFVLQVPRRTPDAQNAQCALGPTAPERLGPAGRPAAGIEWAVQAVIAPVYLGTATPEGARQAAAPAGHEEDSLKAAAAGTVLLEGVQPDQDAGHFCPLGVAHGERPRRHAVVRGREAGRERRIVQRNAPAAEVDNALRLARELDGGRRVLLRQEDARAAIV